MSQVAIIGVGQTSYGLFPERSMGSLFGEAVTNALSDVPKGLGRSDIDEVFVGSLATGGGQLGNLAPLVTEAAGLAGKPTCHIENACASSSFAFRAAVAAVASGQARIALAGGVEKMSDLPRERNRMWLGVSSDVEWERLAGNNFPGVFALMARRYMHEYGASLDDLAAVTIKNRKHAMLNPKAQNRRPMDAAETARSPMIADPLRLCDACSISDGASAVIVCRSDLARSFTDCPILVAGSGAASDTTAIHDRPTLTSFPAVEQAARMAYKEAGIAPKDIDLAEVHDCFSIAEIIAMEDLGLCPRGQGAALVASGETTLGGRLPVNCSGGLLAKGHPIGATGTGQIYELCQQLRGQAEEPERQVKGARIAVAHNVGGSGASVTVHVLKSVD